MTTPNTIAQTLERARGLLAHLVDQNEVDQYKAREPARLGGTQTPEHAGPRFEHRGREWRMWPKTPRTAVKRLRDFSKIIERHKPTAEELVNSLRLAADQFAGCCPRAA